MLKIKKCLNIQKNCKIKYVDLKPFLYETNYVLIKQVRSPKKYALRIKIRALVIRYNLLIIIIVIK